MTKMSIFLFLLITTALAESWSFSAVSSSLTNATVTHQMSLGSSIQCLEMPDFTQGATTYTSDARVCIKAAHVRVGTYFEPSGLYCNTYEVILTDAQSPLLIPSSKQTSAHPALPSHALYCMSGARGRGVHYLARDCGETVMLFKTKRAEITTALTLEVTIDGVPTQVSCTQGACSDVDHTYTVSTPAAATSWHDTFDQDADWVANVTAYDIADPSPAELSRVTSIAAADIKSVPSSFPLAVMMRDPTAFTDEKCTGPAHTFTATSDAAPGDQLAPLRAAPSVAADGLTGAVTVDYSTGSAGGSMWNDMEGEVATVEIVVRGVPVASI